MKPSSSGVWQPVGLIEMLGGEIGALSLKMRMASVEMLGGEAGARVEREICAEVSGGEVGTPVVRDVGTPVVREACIRTESNRYFRCGCMVKRRRWERMNAC